jgi:hypothetical protein
VGSFRKEVESSLWGLQTDDTVRKSRQEGKEPVPAGGRSEIVRLQIL